MLRNAAIAWVQRNCHEPKLYKDVSRSLDDAAAAREDLFFLFGGNLTRRKTPYLLHCFGDEVFIFQLTDAQAAACGIQRDEMRVGRNSRSIKDTLAKPLITIDRFELNDALLKESQLILGRIHFQMNANIFDHYSVRLDYAFGRDVDTAFDHSLRPLKGKGVLDVSFSPITKEPRQATGFKGPLVMFVHFCEMPAPKQTASTPPVSNFAAALVEIV